MQKSKTILLALIFTMSFTFTIFYFVQTIIATINPPWLEGNEEGKETVYYWIVWTLFLLSSISSFFWLINKTSFWLWKIPAMFILPLSIPFLIIDYLESRKKQEITEKNKKINQKTSQLIFLLFVIIINLLIVIPGESFTALLLIYFSNWFWFWALFPIFTICGSTFLILNYFYPKKVFAWLSAFGLTLNWVYLLWGLIDKNKVNYFFQPTSPMIQE